MPRQDQGVQGLVARFAITDSELYQILKALSDSVTDLNDEVFPEERVISISEPAEPPADPSGFIFEILDRAVKFSWDITSGAQYYELKKGQVWDTGDIQVRTTTNGAALDPIPAGTHYYMLRAFASDGTPSENFETLEVIIPAISAFIVSAQTIDNTVLLYWTVPTSPYEIDFYRIYRDTTPIGEIKGTFTTIYELIAGTFDYGVEAVDIAGSVSAKIVVEATVTQPPDFELQDVQVSTLNGTRTNVALISDPLALLACVVEETYEEHFDDNVWDDPQDQIDAGYPLYIQPAAVTGKYEEPDIDYGSILTNVIATISFASTFINSPNVVATVKMWGSDDDIDWSDGPHTGASHFFASMRYLRVHIEFTSASDLSLMYVAELTTTLNVKRENDGGEKACLASDATGTPVTFNKSFLDIDTVTATAKATTDYSVVVDFVDVPNPTGFSIYVFDGSGNRVDATVEWKARGIV